MDAYPGAIADRSLSMLMSASADEEAGVDGSSTDVPELATMIEAHELVDVRMVLIRVIEGWPLVHGEVTLDAVAPMRDRTWQYPEDVFLDRRLPGSVAGRSYAVNPVKPEFYVRRGASTVPARSGETASRFGQQRGGIRHGTW